MLRSLAQRDRKTDTIFLILIYQSPETPIITIIWLWWEVSGKGLAKLVFLKLSERLYAQDKCFIVERLILLDIKKFYNNVIKTLWHWQT